VGLLQPTCFPQGTEKALSLADLLFSTQLIQILQSLLSPRFDRIFEAITLLGNDAFLVGLTAIVYWCFDKRRGRLVTYILFLGAYLNFFLKVLIPWPRPPVELRIVEKSESSYGFPSGNTQDATTFWTWVSLDFRKRVLAVLGTVIVLAVGISRIYLGVHYPAQVIGGWAIGFAVAGLGIITVKRIPWGGKEIHVTGQVLFAFATLIPLLIAVILGAAGEINPGQIGGYLFAFSLGTIVEERYVRFGTEIRASRKAVRVVIGGVIVGSLVLALDPILPLTYLVSAFANSFIRGLAVVLISPAVFKIIERR